MIFFAYFPLLVYFLLEFRRKTPIRENKGNKGSNLLIGSVFMLMILIPTLIYLYHMNGKVKETSWYHWIGICMGLLGVTIRWFAIGRLGRFYSRNVGIQGEHQLIQAGWYKYIRHPGYLGTFLTFFGYSISSGLWVAIVINIILFFIAYSYRIQVEENAMTMEFGKQYIEYQKKLGE